ncbi:hypothetical protein ACFQ4L_05815 [Lapidilactobacillus mulanensis]|uniref:Uncharacterized protein n=1 Tax=Lapidilactobacillus mulanensis TaxID=2485999 RepID=A0ABW4DR43_9LACO|nr:hypothetical protein [Lapidilactobacillus mulanensis]
MKKRNGTKSKVLGLGLTLVAFLGLFIGGQTVFANSQSINISYKTVGGNGIVSGKTNGVWHYFAKGHTATLKVTSKSGAGTSYANLKRSVSLWLDSDYGDVNTKIGSHSFSKKTDVTSGMN